MPSMIVHDNRLSGGTPLYYNYVMKVGRRTSINHIIGTVRRYGGIRKLDKLHILCHGFEAHWDLGAGMSVPAAHGGFGLQLGRDNLNLYNASLTADWKDLVGLIVLFACAPADTGPGNHGTWGDGRRFCGELALWSNAKVVAGRDTQYYDPGGTIDFGAWEGPVFEYTPQNPDGTRIVDPSRFRVHGSAAAARQSASA